MTAAVRGRFAPSPSGRMHLGNVFCALMAWLSARSAGGDMILRIEDLDPDRCRPEYAALLEADLRWLGLDWDAGGMDVPGYSQSQRTEIYAEYYRLLEKQELLYPCFCTRAQRAASAPHLSDGRVVYSGHCRELPLQEAERLRALRSPAVRLRVPDADFAFQDALLGSRTGAYGEYGDFIVRRSDGVYAYQLAVVVDDALMGVTQVVRGRDLLDSTPQQILLYHLLGFTPPSFCHIPLLLSPDGRRLSKRDRDLDLGKLRDRRPEEIIGRLAVLGGLLEQYEPVRARDLVPVFDLGKLPRQDIFVSENMFPEVSQACPRLPKQPRNIM